MMMMMALMAAMVVQWGYQYSRQKMTLDESSGRKNKTENRLFLPQSIKNYVTKSQKNLTDVTYYHQTETELNANAVQKGFTPIKHLTLRK